MFALDATIDARHTAVMGLNLKALVVAWGVTFVLVTAGMLGLGVLYGAHLQQSAKRGWHLQPVVVASRDLTQGTRLAATDLEVLEVPEQLTASALPPAELPRAVGRKLEISLRRHDLIARWMYQKRPLGRSCLVSAQGAAKASHLEGSADVKALLEDLAKTIDGADGGSDGE